MRPEVRAAVEPILFGPHDSGAHGNASSIHWAGREARKHLEGARARIAALTGRKPSEVVLTSGGTEADNLALLGTLLHPKAARKRLVTTAVEHPAVLEAASRLAELGVEVVKVPVGGDGALDLVALERALAERPTGLVSVMAANNETGVVMPIPSVIRLARAHGARVHVDAVQAAGRIAVPWEADLISLSGHKLGGLKGAGALLVREAAPLLPNVLGGPQERGRRAGTENVAAAVGLVVALERSLASLDAESARLRALRDQLDAAIRAIPDTRVLGEGQERLPGTTTALFGGIEGETLLHALDLAGVAASTGSACASGSLEPSHVLLAMGVPPDRALAAVRFSMGWATAASEIDTVIALLPALVARCRASYGSAPGSAAKLPP